MKFHPKDYWKVFKQSVSEFGDQQILKKSAALAYYTVFSLAPMLMIALTVAEFFYGNDAIAGSLYSQIQSLVGATAAVQIQELIKNAAISGDSTFATVVSIVTLVLTATGVFTEIQDSINSIWHLKAKPKTGMIKIVINRLLSFSMVVGLGFIMLVSLMINALIEAFGKALTRLMPDVTVYIIYAINLVVTLGVVTLLFGVIFKLLPDAKIRWKDVLVGSFVTAILFLAGKFGITFYLGASKISSSYGAAGSIIVILLWVYYSSIILYFGATFTRIYAQLKGCSIAPNDYAVFIENVQLENKAPLDEQQTTKEVVQNVEEQENK
jgi:membrane protein